LEAGQVTHWTQLIGPTGNVLATAQVTTYAVPSSLRSVHSMLAQVRALVDKLARLGWCWGPREGSRIDQRRIRCEDARMTPIGAQHARRLDPPLLSAVIRRGSEAACCLAGDHSEAVWQLHRPLLGRGRRRENPVRTFACESRAPGVTMRRVY
jgi:hypothetical protein